MKILPPAAWAHIAALSAISLTLSACGGGGGGSAGGSTSPPPPLTVLTGIFTDAPVAGLAYTCSPSGQAGATNSNGQFGFVEGDSCTFRIGNISLPPVTAATVITPREIAAVISGSAGAGQSAENITQNLFQFFQSLDSDGDASNGITLPTNLGAAFTVTDATTLFDQAPATFESALQARVTEALAVPGNAALPLQVVTQAAAVQHAQEQSQLLLSGTWVNSDLSTAITFLPNGNYLFGGQSDDEQCVTDVAGMVPSPDAAGNGAEYGRYSYDPLSGNFFVTEIISDSTGTCGLSDLDSKNQAKLRVLGDDLIMDNFDTDSQAECTEEGGNPVLVGTATGQTGYTMEGVTYACRYELKRAKGTTSLLSTNPPNADSPQGSFILTSDLVLDIASVLTIEETGANSYRYLLVESYGGNNAPDSENATDGITRGTFTRDAVTGFITVDEVLNTIGGDGGLDNTNEQGIKRIKLERAGVTAHLFLTEFRDPVNGPSATEPDFEATLDRLPLRARITASQVVGSYFPSFFEGSQEIGQAIEELPAILNLLENGDFVIGTYEDDAGCISESSGNQPNGNGIEFGRFSIDSVTGEARFAIPASTELKRYVDTNGECGLNHKGGVSDRYFLRELTDPADGEGYLLVYVDDEGTDGVPAMVRDDLLLAAASEINNISAAKDFSGGAVNDDRGFLVLRPVDSRANAAFNNGLNGSWKMTASTNAIDTLQGEIRPLVVTFYGSQFFVSAGTIGDDPVPNGIEFGTFSINGQSPASLCLQTVEVDTAEDGGLVGNNVEALPDCAAQIAIASDLKTFTLSYAENESTEVLTFTRISKPYAIPMAQ